MTSIEPDGGCRSALELAGVRPTGGEGEEVETAGEGEETRPVAADGGGESALSAVGLR